MDQPKKRRGPRQNTGAALQARARRAEDERVQAERKRERAKAKAEIRRVFQERVALLAEDSSIPHGTLQGWIQPGKGYSATPSAESLYLVARKTGVSTDWLLGLEAAPKYRNQWRTDAKLAEDLSAFVGREVASILGVQWSHIKGDMLSVNGAAVLQEITTSISERLAERVKRAAEAYRVRGRTPDPTEQILRVLASTVSPYFSNAARKELKAEMVRARLATAARDLGDLLGDHAIHIKPEHVLEFLKPIWSDALNVYTLEALQAVEPVDVDGRYYARALEIESMRADFTRSRPRSRVGPSGSSLIRKALEARSKT